LTVLHPGLSNCRRGVSHVTSLAELIRHVRDQIADTILFNKNRAAPSPEA
jgi:hypothetical protein